MNNGSGGGGGGEPRLASMGSGSAFFGGGLVRNTRFF
jgi:hypothetical protein